MLWSIPVITAALLWWLAPRLARLACLNSDQAVDVAGLDIRQLTHVAFVLVGVWIAVFGLIALAGIGVNEAQEAFNPQMAGAPFSWGQFATANLRCLFGVGLVAGGRNLSRILIHLRTAGT